MKKLLEYVNKRRVLLGIIFGIIIIVPYIKLWFSMDEYYTLDLVHNSYRQILIKDTFDVHPPLYYILLKLFFSITLFWKHTILAEVVAGRLFSIIVSLISAHYLIKINNILGIKLNSTIQYIIFILLPNVLFIENLNLSPMVSIRMYALAGLFTVLVWYKLLLFMRDSSLKHLSGVVIFSILASYTHYYAAMIVGFILLCTFMMYLFARNYEKSLKLFISGIVVMLAYIPWVVFAFPNQFAKVNYGQSLHKAIIEILLAVIMLVFFSFQLIRKSNYNDSFKNNHIKIIICVNILVLSIVSIYTVIKSPIFLFRYIYPSLVIVSFVSTSLFVDKFIHQTKKINLTNVCFCLMFAMSIISWGHELIKVTPISASLYKNDEYFSSINSKYIDIDSMKYSIPKYDVNNSYMTNDVQVGMYIRSIGKKPFVNSYSRMISDYNYYPNHRIRPKTVLYKVSE